MLIVISQRKLYLLGQLWSLDFFPFSFYFLTLRFTFFPLIPGGLGNSCGPPSPLCVVPPGLFFPRWSGPSFGKGVVFPTWGGPSRGFPQRGGGPPHPYKVLFRPLGLSQCVGKNFFRFLKNTRALFGQNGVFHKRTPFFCYPPNLGKNPPRYY